MLPRLAAHPHAMGDSMTTESLATEAAENASASDAASEVENTEVEQQTTDEVGSEVTEPGEGNPAEEAEADKVQAEVDKATRRARRRIDKLIAERAQRDERLAQLERELAEAKAAKEDDGTKKPNPADDPVEIARTIRLVEKTAEATSKVLKEGAKYQDFDSAIAELVEELGPQIDKVGRPSALMEAVLDSDKAADVLYHLGKNPEVAAELTGLSAAKLGRRIAQIENELAAKAKPKPSAAAKPLSQVKPSAAPVVDETKLTDAQWRAARLKARLGA